MDVTRLTHIRVASAALVAVVVVVAAASAATPPLPSVSPPPLGPASNVSYGPGPPFPGMPSHTALVHLKAGVCNQVASVRVKTQNAGSAGLVLISDTGGPNGNDSFHWVTNAGTGIPVYRLYAGYSVKLDFHPPVPRSWTFDFASSDCTVNGGGYKPDATIVKVTVTR